MSDTLNLANSIWPNGMKVDSDGYAVFYPLGTNKIDIPTDETDWPQGDKLVSPFVYQNKKLVGFCDTKAMTVDGATTITLPYTHIEADFSSIQSGVLTVEAPNAKVKKYQWSDTIINEGSKYSGCSTVDDVIAIEPNYVTVDIIDGAWTESLADLEDGNSMFQYCINLKSFTSDLSSLTNGVGMFSNCDNLTSFTADLGSLTKGRNMFYNTNISQFVSDLSSLENGENMFYSCNNLSTFTSDLSSLTDGSQMFDECYNLTTFTSDLSSLTDGRNMFYGCSNLSTFTSDLSSLTNGYQMFYNCPSFTTFTSDLSSLTNGYNMFGYCRNLTSFTSNLSSLTNGYLMFRNCKLDTDSLIYIAESIKDVNGLTNDNDPYHNEIYKTIHIGIANSTPSEEEHTYLTQIHNKGWTVYVNGSSSSNIYTPATASLDETGETVSAPIPFWAKPVPSDEEHANYVDAEGNFFNILGGQFIYGDDLSTYGMFTCEEDAAANMRLTKIERN